MKELERWTPTRGSPQGAVISPLLANIYLDPLDAAMAERGYRMKRYADDFVILCRTREEAEAALEDVRAWVSENGLALHPEKTQISDCRQPGQGFEFLGYRFEAGQRHVRKKSLNKLKDSIRAKTKRTRGDSLAHIVADLNRTLRGWFTYFKHHLPAKCLVLLIIRCSTFGVGTGVGHPLWCNEQVHCIASQLFLARLLRIVRREL